MKITVLTDPSDFDYERGYPYAVYVDDELKWSSRMFDGLEELLTTLELKYETVKTSKSWRIEWPSRLDLTWVELSRDHYN